MNTTWKTRALCVTLTVIMVLSMLPLSVFAVENPVAEVTIGSTTTQYTDIDAAFAAAQEAGSATVKLLADVTISHTNDKYGIQIEKGNITLDLNGKTISQSNNGGGWALCAVFYLSVPGPETPDDFATFLDATTSLTVKDSAEGGRIVQPNGVPAVIATLNSTLTVKGGTIENTSSADRDDNQVHMTPNCAVLLHSGGKAVIEGGTLSGIRGVAVAGYIDEEDSGIEGFNNETYGNELTVTGGEIKGTSGNALIVYEKAKKIELSGGMFSNDSTQNAHSIWVADSTPDGVPLKGDAASLLKDGYRYENSDGECAYSAEGNGVVGNATVARRPDNEYTYIDRAEKLTTQANCTEITADTRSLTDGWYVVNTNVELNGTLSVTGKVSLILCDGATLSVNGSVQLSGTGSKMNIFGQTAGTGTLKVTNSDGSAIRIANETSGIELVSGTVVVQAAWGHEPIAGAFGVPSSFKIVRTDDLYQKSVMAGDGTSVTITKCTDHVWIYDKDDEDDSIHWKGCELCSVEYIEESHSYTNWKADEGGTTHTGTCVCGATKTENHTLSCTPNDDGLTHSTKCSVCGYATAAVDHDFSSIDEFGDKKCACGVRLTAEYNGKSYATLASAIEAAKGGGTVTLQAATVTENITIEDETNVTIDLNGKEWAHDDMKSAVPTLIVKGGDVTVQNGTLMAGFTSKADTAVVVEGGKLTVGADMTVLGGSDGDDSGGTRYLPAIEVTKGGKLTLTVGTKLGFGMKVSEGKTLADYLPEGTAFTVNGTAINGYVTEYNSRETLVVAKHSHSYDAEGKCACGAEHRHTGGTAGYFQKAKCAVCGNEYGELAKDTTPPAGRITVTERNWFETFLNTISFNLFFKEELTGKISATDDSSTQAGYDASKYAVKIEYIVSDKALTSAELTDWVQYDAAKGIDLTGEQNYVVYAKLTDWAGNETLLSTEGFVIDKTAPSINGYSGKQTVYVCGTVPYNVGVYDENLEKVSVNGVEKGLNETFTFTYSSSGDNMYTVVATDRAGNTSSITFILREAHDFNTDTGTCLYCGVEPAVKVQVGDELYPFGSFEEAWRAWWYLGEADLPARIILLRDAFPESAGFAFRDRELTLDLNGHLFGDSSKEFSVMADEGYTCKFTVTGNGSFFSKLQVGTNGHLTVEENAGYIERLEILHNKLGETSPTDWSVALKGGKYGSIDLRYTDRDGNEHTAGKLGDLLVPGYVFKTDVADLSTASSVEVEACAGHQWNNGACKFCNLHCGHNLVINGKCTECHMTFVVMDDAGNYYSDLNAAFAGVADGGKLTLLANVTDRATFDADKTVTLNMAGYKLSVSNTSIALVVNNGYLTVADSMGESIDISGKSYSVVMTGGTLKFEKKVKLGGWLIVTSPYDPDTGKYTTLCKLEGGLKEGSIVTGGITVNGYDNSTGEGYENVLDLLPDGYAFAEYKADGTTGSIVRADYSSLDGNLIVVAHEHDNPFTYDNINKGYYCSCGYRHFEHVYGKDGHCTLCDYVCPHDWHFVDTTEDGRRICGKCGAELAAEVTADGTISCYTTFADAIAKANAATGSATVTLLRSEQLTGSLRVTNVSGVALDLNGYALSGKSLNVGGMDAYGNDIPGKLMVTDSSEGNGRIGLEVKGGGTLVFDPGNNKTSIAQLIVWGGDVKLYGGRIQGQDKNKLQLNNGIKMTDLLPVGYAFGLYLGNKTAPNAYISYDKAGKNDMSQWLSAYDLVPVKCEHQMTEVPKGSQYYNMLHCPNCDEALEAVLTTADGKINGYKDLTDSFGRTGALSVAEKTPGCTVTMYYEAEWLSIRSTETGFTLDANDCEIAQLELHEGTLTVKNATITGSTHNSGFTIKTYFDSFGTFSSNLTLEDCEVQKLEGADPTTLSVNGSVTLKNTVVYGKTSVFSITDEGLTVEKSDLYGDVTVRGNLNFKSGYAPKITVYEAAEISGGTIYELDATDAGSLTVSGGTFGKITAPSGKTLMDCLKDGYAFADADTGEVVNGHVSELSDVNVVVHSTHDFHNDAHTCACGVPCEHSDGFNECGVCETCGYACPHDHVTVDGETHTCSDCHAQMVVKVTIGDTATYYAKTFDRWDTENTLQTILNDDTVTPSGSTITLLANDLSAFAFVGDGKTVALNLNGKNLVETVNGGICVDENSTLTVTGQGSSTRTGDPDKNEYSFAFNVRGGTLKFNDNFGGIFNGIRVGSGTLTSTREKKDSIKIGRLQIASSDAKISFKAAAFGKIEIDEGATGVKVKLGDLLGVWRDAEGNTFRSGNAFQKADGTILLYDTEITEDKPIENVKTVACTHDSVTGRTCDYCGTEHLAAIVIDIGGAIATYAAMDDSEAAKIEAVGYVLKGWNEIIGIGKTLKPFVDITLTADAPLNTAVSALTKEKLATIRVLDLNGHKFIGGEYGVLVDELVTLTIKDTSAGKTGVFDNVTLKSGAALVVDGVKIGNLTLNAGSKLEIQNGGFLESVTAAEGKLIDFLAEGYAFVDADGNVKDARATTLTNVTLAEHTHGDYRWDAATHEQVCACGHVRDTDTTAPTFSGIADGENYYQNTLTFTAEDTGSGLASVKDGDTVLTPDANGEYTITADNKPHTITATDNAGNTATVTITVYRVYKITRPSGTGYTVTGPDTVNHGDEYVFNVRLDDGYSRVPGRYKVTAGGFELTAMAGDNTYDQYWIPSVTGNLTITVEGIADITAPDVEMTIGENKFKELLNSLTFGLFFKKTQTVTVTAADLGSRVDDATAEYLVIDGLFDKTSMPTEGWTSFDMKNGKGSFSIEPNAMGSVYVRVKDKAGNTALINSDGVVIYTDSTADTESITFTRLSDEDVSFKVNLNGNWFDRLLINDGKTTSSINGIISSDGTVTLKNEELRKLAAGEYTITVTYHPLGQQYVEAEGNEAPASTTVKLTVLRATRTTLVIDAPDADYDGKAYDELTITDKPDGTTVEYLVDGSYTTDAPKNVGSYTVRITTPQDGNYNAATFTATFTISPRKVTINDVTADSKTYDGNTEATVNADGATLSVNFDGENLTVDASNAKAVFDSKNVGSRAVTFSGFALGGSAASNYELAAQPASVTADIAAKNLTVENLKVKDKVYDGTDKAELDGTPTLKGVETGDEVQLNCGMPTFAATDVGENIAIRFTEFTLTGADSGNYTLTQPTGITGNIAAWIVDGSEYSVNSNDWINTDFIVKANDGYRLSLTNTANGTWTDTLTASEETDKGELVFYVQNVATGVISAAVTEHYKIDKTAPVGTITLEDLDFFPDLLETISFDTFLNEDVIVKISAGDGESGVKSVSYYKSDKTLDKNQLDHGVTWTEGRDLTITAEDGTKFVVYARIEDNAGNVTYLSTDGMVFDTIAPKISGVENGKTYYVTQRATVEDVNILAITLNGVGVLPGSYAELMGDTDAVYEIIAYDKAGNLIRISVIMKPISSITDAIKDITEENVKSSDAEAIKAVEQQILAILSESDAEVIGEEQWNKLTEATENCKKLQERIAAVAAEIARITDAVNAYDIDKVTSADKADIEQLLADIDALLAGNNLTDTERAALEALRNTLQALLDRLAEAKAAAESDEILAVEDITEDNVTLDDKDALETAKKALEDALDNFGGNYTDGERDDLNDRLDAIKAALDAIGNAEKAAEEIEKLPSVEDVKLTDKDEVERVSQLVEALTENEKTMLGEEATGKLEALRKQIKALEAKADPKTGDTGNLGLYIALLFVSGGVITGAAAAGKKRKQKNG